MTPLHPRSQDAQQAKGTVGQIAQAFRIDSPIQADVQKLLMEPDHQCRAAA